MNQICRCQPLLGTYVEVNIEADCDDVQLVKTSNLALIAIKQVHQALSFHDPKSELSQINQTAYIQPMKTSIMAGEVLSLAQQLYNKTQGVYDVSMAPLLIENGYLPTSNQWSQSHLEQCTSNNLHAMQLDDQKVYFEKPLLLDLGGIAKGYAVDCAMQSVVKELGDCLQQVTINAGGDMKVYNWQSVEVMIPNLKKSMQTIAMRNAALASSSSYYLRGKSGIFDAANGEQVALSATISVFADQCMLADALTKVAALLGTEHSIFNDYKAQVVLT